MRIPIIRGVIDRRILVNFRIDADTLAKVLPPPFRPKLVNGYGVGGICLIRLKDVRPRFVPPVFGIDSENAAHRFAVEWDCDGLTQEGVYIPRRDTSSRLNAFVGGRLFPGEHRLANFQCTETADRYQVCLDSDDGVTSVTVDGTIAPDLPKSSVFGTMESCSSFFECGSLGYSATSREGVYDGLELRTFHWEMQPLDVDHVESSYFENSAVFPSGSVEFDCALLMRDIAHEWIGRPTLDSTQAKVA